MGKYSFKEKLLLLVATSGGLGFLPKAPGTFGTLGGVVIYLLTGNLSWYIRLTVALLVTLLSIPVAHKTGKLLGKTDDGRIVIDEVAGYLVASLFVSNFSWLQALILFGAFRLFDITKPWPASYFDRRVENGFGVTMDDVAAGCYAGLLTMLINLALVKWGLL